MCITPFRNSFRFIDADDVGLELCPSQNTPLPFKYDDTYLYYDVDVEMQMPVEHLPKGNVRLIVQK